MTSTDGPLLDRAAGREDQGRRVDAVVADWLGEPRSRVQQRVAAGDVRIDDTPVAKSHRLSIGERVVVRPAAAEPAPPPPPAVPLRYDDEHVAVVAKPAGLVVHAGAGTRGGTLVHALQAMGVRLAEGAHPDRPGIVHRLDRGTSGLLVVAKTDVAYQELVARFRRREVERVYWALVDGVPATPSATIEAPIARSQTRRTRFTVDPGGRRAVSHYDVDADHGRCAVLSVRLETGRTHQVRVHMASIGHPVTGDRRYGASPDLARLLDLHRPALHARRLGFDHPVTGRRVALDEPLPEDLRRALEILSGERPGA